MIKTLAAVLLVVLCMTAPSFADAAFSCVETTLPFKVVNNTGNDIAAIYIARTATGAWSENIIPAGIIRDGEAVDVQVARGGVFYLWDMKVIDAGLGETVIERLPLSDIYDLELLPDAKTNYYVIKAGT